MIDGEGTDGELFNASFEDSQTPDGDGSNGERADRCCPKSESTESDGTDGAIGCFEGICSVVCLLHKSHLLDLAIFDNL
jgi:hypothetical protein